MRFTGEQSLGAMHLVQVLLRTRIAPRSHHRVRRMPQPCRRPPAPTPYAALSARHLPDETRTTRNRGRPRRRHAMPICRLSESASCPAAGERATEAYQQCRSDRSRNVQCPHSEACRRRYWYAAFTVRVSSSVSSSVGVSNSLSPGFVAGAAGFDLVIDVTPGTVTSRRPTFTRSPAPGRRLFLIMRNPAAWPTPGKSGISPPERLDRRVSQKFPDRGSAPK
jgi:hypothetical protein